MSPALEKLQSGKFIMFSFVLLLLCNLSKVREVLKLQNGKKKDRKKNNIHVRVGKARHCVHYGAAVVHCLEFEGAGGKRNRTKPPQK